MASSGGSFTLTTEARTYALRRIAQLGVSRGTYIAGLLANYLYGRRRPLPSVVADERLARVRLQVSLPARLREAAAQAASHRGVSLSELVERLLRADAAATGDGWHLCPVPGVPRPRLSLRVEPRRPSVSP